MAKQGAFTALRVLRSLLKQMDNVSAATRARVVLVVVGYNIAKHGHLECSWHAHGQGLRARARCAAC